MIIGRSESRCPKVKAKVLPIPQAGRKKFCIMVRIGKTDEAKEMLMELKRL